MNLIIKRSKTYPFQKQFKKAMNILPKVLGVSKRTKFFFISSHKNTAPHRFIILDLDGSV